MKHCLTGIFVVLFFSSLFTGCGLRHKQGKVPDDLLSGRYRVIPHEGEGDQEPYFFVVEKTATGWLMRANAPDNDTASLIEIKREGEDFQLAGIFPADVLPDSQCAYSPRGLMIGATVPGTRPVNKDLFIQNPERTPSSEPVVFTTGYFLMVVDGGVWDLAKVAGKH